MAKAGMRYSGGGPPRFVVEHPYYLQSMCCNPYIGTVHDGVSTGYHKGFKVKPIHWLYRFRYNYLPRGIPTGMFNKNPPGKAVHWLEVSNWEKFRLAITSEESKAPVYLSIAVIAVTIWHLWRSAWYHPDITLYNIAMWTTKPWVEGFRANKKWPMDKPVFRWFQRAPEFYAYDMYRDMIKMDIIVNDPFIEHVKSLGRGEELTIYAGERAPGGKGYGHLVPDALYETPKNSNGKHGGGGHH